MRTKSANVRKAHLTRLGRFSSLLSQPLIFPIDPIHCKILHILIHRAPNRRKKPLWLIQIHADTARLHQLITNLLENSVRYTDAGGVVQLSVQAVDGMAILDCQDSAPSVDAADLPRLFERLYRVEGSRNRATGGAGLGLPLCQSIVEAHHGHIHAQPSAQGGLWLRVQLPLSESAPAGSALHSSTPS